MRVPFCVSGTRGICLAVQFERGDKRYQAPSFDKTALATAVARSDVLSCPGAVASNVRPPALNTTVVYSPAGCPMAMHASLPTPLNGSLPGVSRH